MNGDNTVYYITFSFIQQARHTRTQPCPNARLHDCTNAHVFPDALSTNSFHYLYLGVKSRNKTSSHILVPTLTYNLKFSVHRQNMSGSSRVSE